MLEGGVWGVYAFGVVIIIVDAIKWPHPVQVLGLSNKILSFWFSALYISMRGRWLLLLLLFNYLKSIVEFLLHTDYLLQNITTKYS